MFARGPPFSGAKCKFSQVYLSVWITGFITQLTIVQPAEEYITFNSTYHFYIEVFFSQPQLSNEKNLVVQGI